MRRVTLSPEASYRLRYYSSATYRRARARENRRILAGMALVVTGSGVLPLALLYFFG